MDPLNHYTATAIKMIIEFTLQFVLAVVVLLIGLWVIKWKSKGIRLSMEKSNANPTLIPFISNLTS